MGATRASRVAFTAWGHPAVRGSHAKTLEISLDPEISPRATCVVGVRTEVEASELSGFSGPLTISLRVAQYEAVVRATAHVGFRLTSRIVIRRSQHRSADTLAVGADRAARDLPRDLVEALTRSDTRLLVTVEGQRSELASRGGRLLLIAAPAAWDAESDAPLRESTLLVGGRAARRLAETVRGEAEVVAADAAGLERALAELRAGGAVALVLEPSLLGRTRAEQELLASAVASGIPVETAAGFPPEAAALLVSGFPAGAEVTVGRPPAGKKLRDSDLEVVGRTAAVVWRLPGVALERVLGQLGERFSELAACAILDPARPGETAVRGTVGSLRSLVKGAARRRGEVLLVLHSGLQAALPPAGPGPPELSPLLRALRREGVPDRTLARALVSVTGWGRRRSYSALQALSSEEAVRPAPRPRAGR